MQRPRTKWKVCGAVCNTLLYPITVTLLACTACTGSIASLSRAGGSGGGGCMLRQCAMEFDRLMQRDKVMPAATPTYCQLLKVYAECLSSTSGPCRGDLHYHGIESVLERERHTLQCRTVLLAHRTGNTTATGGQCTQRHRATGTHRLCQLFGNTHVRTFDAQYATCHTKGAWPLVDNDYFAVQITVSPADDALAKHTLAASITQITVIVKSLSGCTAERLYTAYGNDSAVPRTFVDGTDGRGRGPPTGTLAQAHGHRRHRAQPPVHIVAHSLDHVEIRLRYISTRISVRRHGGHLSAFVRLPQSLATGAHRQRWGQLCTAGCPPAAAIALGDALGDEPAMRRCAANGRGLSRAAALDICTKQFGVVDMYMEACVYDMMLSGDTAFASAAQCALGDMRHTHSAYAAHVMTNRTHLRLYEHSAQTATGGTGGTLHALCPQAHAVAAVGELSSSAARTLTCAHCGLFIVLLLVMLL